MDTFSEELVQRLIAHLRDKHDHIISEETARGYLHLYAGLFLSFVKSDVEHHHEKTSST